MHTVLLGGNRPVDQLGEDFDASLTEHSSGPTTVTEYRHVQADVSGKVSRGVYKRP